MKERRTRIWFVGLVAAFALLQVASVAGAVDCAFEDLNDNGILDAGDNLVPHAAWIGGVPFVSGNPFVVPVGCDKTLVLGPAVTNGVRVTAAKITFLGRLEYLPQGGRGVVFVSNGDLIVGDGTDLALIRAGGHNLLAANEIAVFRRSVALVGTGECTFNNAEIRGNLPLQDTQVGIRCVIMIAGAGAGNNLDVQGASLVGRYRVTLAAEDGNLLTQNAFIDHGEQLGLTAPGGAKIWLFANPAAVLRLPVDREDFTGPSAGSTNIFGACYRSPNPVQVGQNGVGAINLIGASAPSPCLQNPPDFVPVLNGIF